ncbi:MAG: hypothetical protein N2446_00015 [Elusimicrobiales bacterium]|nr:hypothetical protein [Elusimicrobiales bacterium]
MIKFKNLKEIYSILYNYYGPQGWWPIMSLKEDRLVYRKNFFGPLSEDECFEISCGAILTQNISWRNVEKCITNLKKTNFLSPQKILNASSEEIHLLIKPSGYYRQKTLKLKNFSKWVIDQGGKLKKIFKKNPKEIRKELLNIKGIGKETADSILLYAGCLPFFVIDFYTVRLVNRVYLINVCDYEELQNIFHSNLVNDFKIFNEYHALIVEHSKKFCKKELNNCKDCPILKICLEGKKYVNKRKN